MNPDQTKKFERRAVLGEIAWTFLRRGFVAFGGPAAHIAPMEEQFVRRRVVSRTRFLGMVGAGSLPDLFGVGTFFVSISRIGRIVTL